LFGPDLLPGMYSTPIHAVPKGESDLQLVTDQSTGNFSLNSMILHEDIMGTPLNNLKDLGDALLQFRCEFGPVQLTLFKSDIAEAFCLMPFHFHWQIKQINIVDGMRLVDRNVPFGGCGSSKIWCSFNVLVIWIAINVKGIELLFAYVDDEFSFDLTGNVSYYAKYNKYLPKKQTKLLQLWDELGIPHKEKKQLSGTPLKIIGFDVDANKLTYTMSEIWKKELIVAIRHFTSLSGTKGRRFSLCDFQRLAGWSNWAFNVFPLLKPGLSSLYTKTTGKQKANAKIWVNNTIRDDLNWMADHMEKSDGVHLLKNLDWDPAEADATIFCDTSLLGMGFWYPELLLGYHCPIDFEAPSDVIFFFEALCVCSAFHDVVGLSIETKTLVIYTDNTNTVDIFNSLCASEAYNPILKSAIDVALKHGINFRVLHVPGSDNTIADALSRNNLDLAQSLVPGIQLEPFQPPRDALGAIKK
jgi:hypothetical protein